MLQDIAEGRERVQCRLVEHVGKPEDSVKGLGRELAFASLLAPTLTMGREKEPACSD